MLLQHACPLCYPNDDQIVANGETAGTIRRRDAKRIADMRLDSEVKIKWECLVKARIACKDEMREFFGNCLDTGPIDLHDVRNNERIN